MTAYDLHVIPVPRGMTAEEAHLEQQVMGRLIEYRWWRPRFHWPFRRWALVKVER